MYKISDVVMFVVTEPNLKSMGKVLEKLVEWSQKAEMSSVNRRSLPSHIIWINQCDLAKTKSIEARRDHGPDSQGECKPDGWQ